MEPSVVTHHRRRQYYLLMGPSCSQQVRTSSPLAEAVPFPFPAPSMERWSFLFYSQRRRVGDFFRSDRKQYSSYFSHRAAGIWFFYFSNIGTVPNGTMTFGGPRSRLQGRFRSHATGRTQPMSIATIIGTGNLTITSSSFTMGANESMTVLGNLSIDRSAHPQRYRRRGQSHPHWIEHHLESTGTGELFGLNRFFLYLSECAYHRSKCANCQPIRYSRRFSRARFGVLQRVVVCQSA